MVGIRWLRQCLILRPSGLRSIYQTSARPAIRTFPRRSAAVRRHGAASAQGGALLSPSALRSTTHRPEICAPACGPGTRWNGRTVPLRTNDRPPHTPRRILPFLARDAGGAIRPSKSYQRNKLVVPHAHTVPVGEASTDLSTCILTVYCARAPCLRHRPAHEVSARAGRGAERVGFAILASKMLRVLVVLMLTAFPCSALAACSCDSVSQRRVPLAALYNASAGVRSAR
jgi:hypothetical protein